MLEITILIPDKLDEEDLQDLLSAIKYQVKYADGVGEYSMEAVVRYGE